MGTLTDYFESDCKGFNVRNSLSLYSSSGDEIGHAIICKVNLLVDAHSKYFSIYSGENVDFGALLKHLENDNIRTCNINKLLSQNEDFTLELSINNGNKVSIKDLVFTKKVIVYIEAKLSEKQQNELIFHGKLQGLNIEIRDNNYAENRSIKERPLAFISHSKNDSRDFAIKLANELSKRGCPVWFDEYSLSIGDSLTESIDEGLKNTDKCIFILSPEFLLNKGWCKHEFRTASMKQIFEKRNIMLPIWHGVQKQDVYEYSPVLVDTVGLSSSVELEEIANKIAKVLLKN